jgi:phytoene dehydrogenase-like protein
VTALDAVVVGSGPNGLAAAITLARAGLAVEVLEAEDAPGGGCRSAALTVDGFTHDTCSTIQSLYGLSPFFASSPEAWSRRGVAVRTAPVALAHPLDDGRAATLVRSVDETAAALGADGPRYERLFSPLVEDAERLAAAVLAPIRGVPRGATTLARFAARGLLPATVLARRFRTDEGRALVAGLASHAMIPLDRALTSGIGMFLAVSAHVGGWPVVEGGSARLVDALVEELRSAGGALTCGRRVRTWSDLPDARAVLFDTSAEGLVEIAGARLPARYTRAVSGFARGPGVFKVDWALAGPVPWRAEGCRRAGTVHLGGTVEEIARAEAAVARGEHPDAPFVIAVQATVADPTRAPAGMHTLWAYCHVPNGSTRDMTSAIERQVERYAPGFLDLVVARTTTSCQQAEAHDANYRGGDITGGAGTLRQTLVRPAWTWNPYRTGARGIYLCSASTPPGGGVHGMCGVGAARAALEDLAVRATP